MATSKEPRVVVTAVADLPGLEQRHVAAVVTRAWGLLHGPPGVTVEVAFLDEAEHTRIHMELLNDPSPTDVMAIPYRDADLWGEILVNVDCARREARERGVRDSQEALLYVAHGALHLLGMDDHDLEARAQMRAMEKRLLSS